MQLGTVEGKVNTSNFEFRAVEEVKKFDFVSIKSNDNWILCQVDEVTKHPDGETIAKANIIGYREKGLTKAPRTVIEPDSIVYQADQELISDTLGLDDEGLRIGTLETNPEIDIHVNAEDFYKHFAVLAQTGAGKCVTGDTPVLMSNGETQPIKRIFEQSDDVIKSEEGEELRMLSNCSVKAINENYREKDADALYAYRKKADKILKIKTSSGREIEVTPEHPLMSAENRYDFTRADNISEGQHIAIPRKVDYNSSEKIGLSDCVKSEVEEESERRLHYKQEYETFAKLNEEGRSISEITEKVSVPRSTLENWKYKDYSPNDSTGFADSSNSNAIDIPSEINVDFEPLMKSREKSIPPLILKAPKDVKRAFLTIFFDCEGSMEDHEITLSSASEELVTQLSFMLLEFGVMPRFRESWKKATNSDSEEKKYFELVISGVEQMRAFSEEIGFGIDTKQERLEDYLESTQGNTNSDVIPIEGEYLKEQRTEQNISQRELAEEIGSHSTLVSLYERNKRRPSREKFKQLAEELEDDLYERLATSDLFWDEVESIEEVEHQDYVYDLTVKDHHNFIAGKGGIVCHNSYLTGVIIEELLENDFPVIIVDPHGEYHSLRSENPDSDNPQSYPVTEYSPNTNINSEALPLRFSSLNMDKKELTTLIPDSLTNSQMGVLYNALKRLKEKDDEDYSLIDIEDAVTQEESTAKWNLLNYLEQLEETNLFSQDPIDLEDLVEPGEASVINLKAVEPDASEMTVYMLAQKLFNMRKENKIPPFIMIMEEAHNYVPEKGFGQALSNPIMRKIASEGRKFGVGIGVISQRPARIDKNVLSQANTQFILRVTNPNDLKAISKSFEGITSEIEDMITSLPPGVAFALGNEYPVMTDVRTRKSLHGGETQTNDSYVPQETIQVFDTDMTVQELRKDTGEDYTPAYYPVYRLENEEKEIIVDGVNGEIREEREKLSGKHETVFQHLVQGRSRQEIVEEMEVDIPRLASIIDELKNRELLDEDDEPEEHLLDKSADSRQVDKDDLIDIEIDPEELSHMDNPEVELLYYPYYSKGEEVYDPVLGKHL